MRQLGFREVQIKFASIGEVQIKCVSFGKVALALRRKGSWPYWSINILCYPAKEIAISHF